MEDSSLQKHLLYITKLKAQKLHSDKLVAVTAIWKNNTAYLSFYFNEKPTEHELEDASDTSTEIIAHMSRGMLEDNYVVIESSNQWPNTFLAYKRES